MPSSGRYFTKTNWSEENRDSELLCYYKGRVAPSKTLLEIEDLVLEQTGKDYYDWLGEEEDFVIKNIDKIGERKIINKYKKELDRVGDLKVDKNYLLFLKKINILSQLIKIGEVCGVALLRKKELTDIINKIENILSAKKKLYIIENDLTLSLLKKDRYIKLSEEVKKEWDEYNNKICVLEQQNPVKWRVGTIHTRCK